LIVEDTTSEGQKLGSMGALKQVYEQIKVPFNEGVLVVGGDNIASLNLLDFVNYQRKNKKRSAVALYDIRDEEKAKLYGVAKLNKKNSTRTRGKKIVNFEEKPQKPKSSLVSTAIYMFRGKDLSKIGNYLKESKNADTIGSYLRWLIEDGKKSRTEHCFKNNFNKANRSGVNGFVFEGHWFDIGSYESLNEADKFFQRQNSSD